MNGNQEVFRRIEKKYIVDEPTYEKLIKKLDGHFVKDRYYKSTICNIYYDTPSHQLVRNSIEKPVYKEKLRVRSYGVPNDEDMVFVELKNKGSSVSPSAGLRRNCHGFAKFVDSPQEATPRVRKKLSPRLSASGSKNSGG
mgnify:CR=1 FL=1